MKYLATGLNMLICGSRAATPPMIEYAKACAFRALEQGYTLLVGDAPGVDQAVAELVNAVYPSLTLSKAWPYKHVCRVAGLADQPRHGVTGTGIEYVKLARLLMHRYYDGEGRWSALPVKSYTDRDRVLVRLADDVMCIWNGNSKGTKAVHDYAIDQGMVGHCWLRNFGDESQTNAA